MLNQSSGSLFFLGVLSSLVQVYLIYSNELVPCNQNVCRQHLYQTYKSNILHVYKCCLKLDLPCFANPDIGILHHRKGSLATLPRSVVQWCRGTLLRAVLDDSHT